MAHLHNYTLQQSYLFRFEKDFEHLVAINWFRANWVLICPCVIILYLVLIFVGQHHMKNRPRFELKRSLAIWNILLACFSTLGAFRMLPDLLYVIRSHGTYHSVCITSHVECNRVSAFWTMTFVMSKVPELFDTMFIVLRKQPMIFLHWYHHVTVLFYTWFSYSEYNSASRWFITMNYIAHAIMYSYFALKSFNFAVPRIISMVITVIQLAQMLVGCLVNFLVIKIKWSGLDCNVSNVNILLSLLMYGSYFVLFGHFFYKSYVSPNKVRTSGMEKIKEN